MLKDINFPQTLEYASDEKDIPLEFYLDVFPECKEIQLKLGYFSSKAIQTLAFGFAKFIQNGGKITIISNHFLYENDIELLDKAVIDDVDKKNIEDFQGLYDQLNSSISHCINCLKYLIKIGRFEIIPVKLNPGRMVHYKQGLFFDKNGDVVFSDGSCNFTGNGLLENAESLAVSRSWGSEVEAVRVRKKIDNIQSIISKQNTDYQYLNKHQIENAITVKGEDKSLKELIDDEKKILNGLVNNKTKLIIKRYLKKVQEDLNRINLEPKFPFLEGPRQYQLDALNAWQENNKKGIFAMATGTGKTVTSLNCLLSEYNEKGEYQALILVPTLPLVDQWFEEVRSFNFKTIIKVSSKNKRWRTQVDNKLSNLIFNPKESFVIICTYDSFCDSFKQRAEKLPSSTMLIADEAHNMGRESLKKVIQNTAYEKRIGLSATPKRRFDEGGNIFIETYFNSVSPYTYSYSMKRALDEGVLCKYKYTVHAVQLDDDEMAEYRKITRDLMNYFDEKTGGFGNSEASKMLLLKRRRVIHKARNKRGTLRKLLRNIIDDKQKLDWTFIYCPEGEDENGQAILDQYMHDLEEFFPDTRSHHYTSETEHRDDVMKNFENGIFQVLFSMKCLDEGVDVPRAETAIFCASTGNPREFIQRRGRVLRKHKDKDFANIHDFVVIPPLPEQKNSNSIESRLIELEFQRVGHFASLAVNQYEVLEFLHPMALNFGIDLYALQKNIKELQND